MKRIAFLWLWATITPAAAQFSTDLSVFTNLTRNIDVSHPRVNLGLFRETWNHKIGLSIGRYVPNFYWQEPARGTSVELLFQIHLTDVYELCMGASYGDLRYEVAEGLAECALQKRLVDVHLEICKRYRVSGPLWAQPFGGFGWRYKRTGTLAGPENDEPPSVSIHSFRDDVGETGVVTIRFGILIGWQFVHDHRLRSRLLDE